MVRTSIESIKCPWCKGEATKWTTENGEGGSYYCSVCKMNVKERWNERLKRTIKILSKAMPR